MFAKNCKLCGKLVGLVDVQEASESFAAPGKQPTPTKTEEDKLHPLSTWFLDITEVKDECAKKDDSDSIKVEEGPSVIEEDKIQEHWIVDGLLLLILPDSSFVNMFSIIRTVFNRLKLIGSTLRFEVADFFVRHKNSTFVVCKVTAKQLIPASPPHCL